MQPILEIQGVSKKFHVGGLKQPYLSLRESITSIFKKQKAEEEFWALKDVSFNVYPGESIGIIGRNGAGKSTLLKILSKITPPSTGKIISRGRIASLLEVGTGFHMELTGRENIYLNGSILGLKKSEINRQFDAIVEFSGIEQFLDTPLKHYSSGMQLRLAFAVAAHLEPEILIIDEVLAVGDDAFQKKCINKMNEVSHSGRTILFVSHNIAAVKSLCQKGILLNKGSVELYGDINTVTSSYLNLYVSASNSSAMYISDGKNKKASYIKSISVENDAAQVSDNFSFEQNIHLRITLRVDALHLKASLSIRIKDQLERNIFTTQTQLESFITNAGEHVLHVTIPGKVLVSNFYSMVVGLHIPNQELIEVLESPVSFHIEETGSELFQYSGNDYGCVFVDCEWSL